MTAEEAKQLAEDYADFIDKMIKVGDLKDDGMDLRAILWKRAD